MGSSASFTTSSLPLLISLLLLLSVLYSTNTASSSATHEAFLLCISIHSPKFSHEILHAQNTSSYNLRFSSIIKTIPSRKPLFILTPVHASEIQAAVLCSRKHGLQVRVRSGGHDYEGLSTTCNFSPFIIIDLVKFRSITVNLDDETAWVEAGATIGEVYYKIAERSKIHGFPAGTCPTVGVGGHFSGGGFGIMSRKYGTSADNIIDANLVDANGRVLDRKSMGEDLFWAIRGGGGASFGVIISWKIKLVHVPSQVTVFTVHRTLEQGATKLVQRWQHIADKFHEDLLIRIILTISQGKRRKTIRAAFNSLFLGGVKDVLPLMEQSFPELGLRAHDCTEMSWIESVLYFAGYPRGTSLDVLLNRTHRENIFFKAKSDFVQRPISEKGLEGIWKMFLEEKVAVMIMDPFGGMMSKISESATPFPHRKGNLYNIQYLVKWDEEGDVAASQRHIEWIRKLYRHMRPYVSNSPRAAYLNYRDLDLGTNGPDGNSSFSTAEVWGSKYFKRNFYRLALVKGKVDPDNFFRNEQSVPPLIA